MEISHTENQPVKILDAVVCDVCGRRVTPADHAEYHEMIRVGGLGGYDSVIGDGVRWTLDVCQRCFVERFGQFVQKRQDIITIDGG